ncbi:MAG: hypothetical protein LLG20_03995 [Acidobacteriales bacterium]|nr:hypothetical protein [Terriglobales bacterium]
MKTVTTLLLAAGLLAAADTRTFVGVITDTMCGTDHKHMGVSPDEKCVRDCVKQGAKYALYDGKEVYRLSDQQTPEKFAAKKVKVTGILYEKTRIIKVEKIEAAR